MIRSFICRGWCSIVMIEIGGSPQQATHFEGTWREAEKLGWVFTSQTRWALTPKDPIFLCPKCAKKEGLLSE